LTFDYNLVWSFLPIDTTTVVVPTQKNQLKQPSTTKFDSSWWSFWANSWDSSGLYRGPRFVHKRDKMSFFYPLKIGMNSKQWGEKQSKPKFEKNQLFPLFPFFSLPVNFLPLSLSCLCYHCHYQHHAGPPSMTTNHLRASLPPQFCMQDVN